MRLFKCLLIAPVLMLLWYPAKRWKVFDSFGSSLIDWADPEILNGRN